MTYINDCISHTHTENEKPIFIGKILQICLKLVLESRKVYLSRSKSRKVDLKGRQVNLTRTTPRRGPWEPRQIVGDIHCLGIFDSKCINVWPWKLRWRSWCTTFTVVPFDGECQPQRNIMGCIFAIAHCFHDISISNLWP